MGIYLYIVPFIYCWRPRYSEKTNYLWQVSDKLHHIKLFWIQLAIDIILRVYERGIQAVHRSGARRVKKGPGISERPYSLSHGHFILIFSFFGGIFNSNPQFWMKSQPVPRAQSSFVPHCKISLGGPDNSDYHTNMATIGLARKENTFHSRTDF